LEDWHPSMVVLARSVPVNIRHWLIALGPL
jgi:hypothetical protein